ncbi:MAG: hypothetical protein HYZ00_05565, partial [Candidatus Hydrogenedentes bacterium]|nr:hypothetical protein [Candidatus Hydrogenedentota bacterium]
MTFRYYVLLVFMPLPGLQPIAGGDLQINIVGAGNHRSATVVDQGSTVFRGLVQDTDVLLTRAAEHGPEATPIYFATEQRAGDRVDLLGGEAGDLSIDESFRALSLDLIERV